MTDKQCANFQLILVGFMTIIGIIAVWLTGRFQ